MHILILIGAVLTIAGMLGLGYCIRLAMQARKAGTGTGTGPDLQRARLQQAMVWNLGALFVSAIGLMAVVVGVILG